VFQRHDDKHFSALVKDLLHLSNQITFESKCVVWRRLFNTANPVHVCCYTQCMEQYRLFCGQVYRRIWQAWILSFKSRYQLFFLYSSHSVLLGT